MLSSRGPLFGRSDYVYYRSETLARPLTVVGNVDVDLWAASSAEDTDFIAKLCVIEPSGAVTCLSYGSLRCKYRESWSDPKPLDPDQPVRLRVRMGHMAYVFPKGSRVALIITSSSFPRIVPHTNTLAAPWSGEPPRVATQTILHDVQHPTCLNLPVMDV